MKDTNKKLEYELSIRQCCFMMEAHEVFGNVTKTEDTIKREVISCRIAK